MPGETHIRYRELRAYKYQLVENYTVAISLAPDAAIDTGYIRLTTDGILTISKSYAWDGPSGPTIDTPSFMRGSLVHDALYQLMRGQHLNAARHRETADKILKQLCVEDGMWSLRAAYVYRAVRLFAGKNAEPKRGLEPQEIILQAP